MKQERLPELDGIRGCAILLVLIWHYVPCEIHPPGANVLTLALGVMFSLAHTGVDLFFVLSGFLITGILLDNRGAGNYFAVFYARRVCRIFPLYFFVVGLFAALIALGAEGWPELTWLFHEPLPLWSYATFTQNVLMGLQGRYGPHWVGVTWSLAVEEQFYCVIPLMVWLLPRRTFLRVAIMLVCLAPLLRAICGGLAAGVWAPCRADSLLIGALLAVAVRDPIVMGLFRANVSVLYACFAGLLGGAFILTISPRAFGVASSTWISLLYGVFLLLSIVHRDTRVASMLRNPVLVWFGLLSYGLYMYHQMVSGLVHGLLGGGEPSIESARGCGLTLLALLLTLLVSATSYYLFERPIFLLGHRFKYRTSEPRPEGALSGAVSSPRP